MTTREKILSKALDLFSVKGFDAVSIRDIAKAVGINGATIYNHFNNKQDIFDCLLSEYTLRENALLYDGDNAFRSAETYKNTTAAQLTELGETIFDFYFTDEKVVKLRKILTIEQYRNDKVGSLFRTLSIENILQFQARLFEALIREGCFRKTDPYLLSIEFFAPLFLLFYKYDHSLGGTAEARALFLSHMRHFDQTYRIRD